MIEIYAVKLKGKVDKELFQYLLNNIEEDNKIRIQKFVKWEDAHRALFAVLLIRHIIIEKLDLKNEDISFFSNEYGKPFLKNFNNFHFNLSHSGIWIVCAIDDLPLGLDIEKIEPIDFNISRRFFSKEEHQDLMNRDECDKLAYFYILWTLKESYLKAIGKGLSQPLKSFTMKFFNDEIKIKSDGKIIDDVFFTMYDIDNNYKMALCASQKETPSQVNIKEIDEIICNFS